MGDHHGARSRGADHVVLVIEQPLSDAGFELVEASLTQAGRNRMLTVLVEPALTEDQLADPVTPLPSLSLDDVADATRVVDAALENSDVLGAAPYVLEVSSPGVGRPLVTRVQFRRNVGRLVELSLHEGHTPADVSGRIVAVREDELDLLVPPTKKTPETTTTVPLGSVRRGKVQVEFRRADTSGDEPDDPAADDDTEEN